MPTFCVRGVAVGVGLWVSAAATPGFAAIGGAAVDQDNLPSAYGSGLAIFGNVEFAQTFQVGTSGALAAIDLPIWRSDALVTNDLIIRVRRASASTLAPTEEVLFSQTISASSLAVDPALPNPPPIFQIDLSSSLIPVAIGDRLSVSLQRSGAGSPPWVVWASSGESYGPGTSWSRGPFSVDGAWLAGGINDFDFMFRTYVVPSPSTGIALAGVGVAALRRRRS